MVRSEAPRGSQLPGRCRARAWAVWPAPGAVPPAPAIAPQLLTGHRATALGAQGAMHLTSSSAQLAGHVRITNRARRLGAPHRGSAPMNPKNPQSLGTLLEVHTPRTQNERLSARDSTKRRGVDLCLVAAAVTKNEVFKGVLHRSPFRSSAPLFGTGGPDRPSVARLPRLRVKGGASAASGERSVP